MALAIAVGHSGVGILGQDVRVSKEAAHQETGEADQVGVRAERQKLAVYGLQSHSKPEGVV